MTISGSLVDSFVMDCVSSHLQVAQRHPCKYHKTIHFSQAQWQEMSESSSAGICLNYLKYLLSFVHYLTRGTLPHSERNLQNRIPPPQKCEKGP